MLDNPILDIVLAVGKANSSSSGTTLSESPLNLDLLSVPHDLNELIQSRSSKISNHLASECPSYKSFQRNGFVKQDCPRVSPSQEASSQSEMGNQGYASPTPFPSLTGLRSNATSGQLGSVTVGSKLTFADLHNATRTLGVSPISALQAAWATILFAYTGAQVDIAFITAIAPASSHGPSLADDGLSLAIPTRVSLYAPQRSEHSKNVSILRRLTEANAWALHENKLAEKPVARHNGQPQYATIIALRNKPPIKDDNCISESVNRHAICGEIAVSIVAWPGVAGFMELKACYTDSVLNKPSASIMLKQMDDILSFILSNPASSISVNSSTFCTSLLSVSNQGLEEPVAAVLDESLLHAQFEKFAKSNPERMALIFKETLQSKAPCDNKAWTYAELNQKAESFATYLFHRFGQLADKIIPICMERRPELYVAILGILKVGAAWCPIDASFPPRRRHDLIARTGSEMLIVAERMVADRTEGIPQGVVTVDITRLEDTADRVESLTTKASTLAYLIWTSGTTGDPKAVPISHKAAVTSMRALQQSIPFDVTGGIVRCLQFSQFTFDVFVQDLFYTWGVGGTVISSTREIMLGSFAELATKTRATHVHLTPAFAASVPRERCPTLEVVTMIGEKLTQGVADDWGQDVRAFNTYGPAETTVVSTLRQFDSVGDEIKSSNIGFPLPSVSAYVIRDGQLVMGQAIGELALGGPQLSKGYWNDPERSQGKFVWNEKYSINLYMTGDIVRQLYDGSLEFVGRTDDLIKIQGIRVELSEISFSLHSCHPLVEQVEIRHLDRQDRPSKVLVAFLAAPQLGKSWTGPDQVNMSNEAVQIGKRALFEAQKNLPDYMVPKVFLVLNTIPRTSSAKVDSAVLHRIYGSTDIRMWERKLASNDGSSTDSAAWSMRESEVLALVTQFSGTSCKSVSRASNLPSIGIDSIGVTRLVQLLNAKGFTLSVADALRCQSLADLMDASNRGSSIPSAERYGLEAFDEKWCRRVKEKLKRRDLFVVPALPLQESLLGESMRNANAYWSNAFFGLNADVNMSRLHEAWLYVVSHTEALRTGFIPSAEILEDYDDASMSAMTFMQLIYEEPVVDWRDVLSSEAGLKDDALQRAHAIAANRQKDHFSTPLFAITVFEQQERRTMMVSIHHAVRDERSLEFLMEDVWKSYHKTLGDSEQRHQLREALRVMLPRKDQIKQDENFWSKTLNIFADNDEPKVWPDLTGKGLLEDDATMRFLTHTYPLTVSYKDLQITATNLGASSVASILRVAWGFVLLEYLETDSIVFAETWSSRTEASMLANVVGPLTTVLPVPFRALRSAREVLAAQSKFQKEARAHRSIHPRLVKKILRRADNQVLYPAVFNFLPDLTGQSTVDGAAKWKRLENMLGLTVEHPVALNVAETVGGVLELELSASEKIMSSTHLSLLAQQMDAFVAAIKTFPDAPLERLTAHFPKSLLSMTFMAPSEAVSQARWQEPTDWVDHYAALHPHWPAAYVANLARNGRFETEGWTFAELHAAYSRVAAVITYSGCNAHVIAVCLDRRLEAYAVILGILGSGSTYLPIDEDLPGERKSFLLQDSAAAMLFTTRPLAASFPNIPNGSRLIYVDEGSYRERIVSSHVTAQSSPPQAGDNAYLLYTSGSTGVPKGVLVSRGNLCAFIESLSEFICVHIPGVNDLPGKGRYLGLASRAFDVHLAEMFLAWRRGMAAVTASRTVLLDNLEMALRELKITHASFVPSLIDHASLDPGNLPDLRYLGIGGEKISRRVIDTWASHENVALVNAYGPTELSIGCCAAAVTPDSNVRNVGRPFGKTVAHILVPGSTRHTMRGVSGELCVTGDLVANGYHNRPDAKGFVEDFNGWRMYRTGDRARLMADGTVEIIGREDDQTKIRGQRLELGEVSETIRAFAATNLGSYTVDVATIVAQHPSMSKPKLVSFVVTDPRSSKAQRSPAILEFANYYNFDKQIHAHCQDILPGYMVPDLVIPITNLPLAPTSGKADGKRLKALFSQIPLSDLTFYTSSEARCQLERKSRELTEAEMSVHNAVVRTLAVDGNAIPHDANLFRVGLDSLSAINLAVRLQKIGYDCNVASIFKNAVIEHLATLPRSKMKEGAQTDKLTQTRTMLSDMESRFRATHSHGLNDSAIHAVRPCLPLQESLVATSLSNMTCPLYVNHVSLSLSARIDHVQLYRAWTTVVADHEIFRTCFQEFENSMVQVVLKQDDCQSLSWEETTSSDPSCDPSAFRLQQGKIAQEIISNISRKAPLRLKLIRPHSAGRSSVLRISIHHALYDGESFSMLLEEVYIRYQSAKPRMRTPFLTLIECVSSQDQRASRDYWKGYLEHYKPTSVANRGNNTNANLANNVSMTAERTLTNTISELDDFATSMSGTLALTIQSIFGVVLAQALETRDAVFGAVLSGRTLPIDDPGSILAPCITTIPQRINFSTGDSSILNIVKSAQKGFVESLVFQHSALKDIHRWVGADRPLFDCLFSYVLKRDSQPWSHLWTELESFMPNDFPLSIEFEVDQEAYSVRARCAFSPAFGDLHKVSSLLENMDLLLGALIRKENVTLEDLNLTDSDAARGSSNSKVWDEDRWSPRELKMQELVAQICGTSAEDISKGRSFFSLGMDSIVAIRLARCLRQSGMECSSADVMRHPCIGELAHHISSLLPHHTNAVCDSAGQAQGADLREYLPNLQTLGPGDTIKEVYTCTPLQSSMLTQTLGSEGRLYVHHQGVLLSPKIDLPRLKYSWECLTVRTEILRTTFHFSKGLDSWLAVVHQECTNSWTKHNIGPSFSDSIAELSKDFVLSEETNFERPPWKTNILESPRATFLIISMHHSLYDGESINLLFQDLLRIYRGIQFQPRPPFSHAARTMLKSKADAENFWIQKLAGFKDSATSQMPKSTGTDMIELEMSLKMDIESILQGCKDLGVTLQSVALLAFGKSLACVLKHRDVVFGHVVGGRSLAVPGADEVVGPMFNTVPFRLILDKTYTTNMKAAIEVQQVLGDSQPHQHASLGRIQRAWRERTGDADAPLLNTVFVFQKGINEELAASKLWTSLNTGEAITPTEHITNFEFEQRENEAILRIASRKELTTREKLWAWLTSFEQIVRDILEQHHRSVMAFPSSLQGLPLTIERKREPLPPQDDVEPGPDLDCIRAALSEISSVPSEQIGPSASIFCLGLDSISAIKVAATCLKQGHRVTVADVLQGRSLGGICRLLRARRVEQNGYRETQSALMNEESRSMALALANTKDADVEDVLPCLGGQVYHLASWLKSGRTTCEPVWIYDCLERLNLDDLRAAWKRLRDRHAVLRTKFVTVSSKEVFQVVLRPLAVMDDSFECFKASKDIHNTVVDLIKQEAKQPFDLSIPPSKLRLIRGSTRDCLLLKYHHAAYDAWTIRKFVADLAALYRGAHLPSPPQFGPFIHHTMRFPLVEEQKIYWRKSLKECQQTLLQPLATPANFPVPVSLKSSTIFVLIKGAVPNLRSLEDACRECSIALHTLFLISFARTLAYQTSTINPIFGLYQAGRSASFEGIDQLCAPCLNVTPVLVPNALTQPPLASAQHLQSDLAERIPFEQGQLHHILDWLGSADKPLFNAYANILWHDEGLREPSESLDDLFILRQTESSMHTEASVERRDGKTAIDGMDVRFIAEQNLFLDVERSSEDDAVHLAIRCNSELMNEEQVRAFAYGIVEEVKRLIQAVGRDGTRN